MNGLNLFILRVYEKRWPKCALISKQNLRTIHWGKKYWDTGLVSEKTKALYAELNETVEAATSSYSATNKFLRYIYSVLVAKNHHKIRSRCLVHKFSFTDIFLNSGLYGCGFLLLLWKGTQKDAQCNSIVPPEVFLFFFSCRAEYYWGWGRSFCLGIFMRREWLWR